jgi:acetate kinase
VTTPQNAAILALNSGSSSLKFGLYRVGASGAEALLSGEAEAIGGAKAAFHAGGARGETIVSDASPIPSQQEAIARIAALIADQALPAPAAIGHRVVHGGPKLRRHCRIDADVMAELESAVDFAPLHAPSILAVIRYAQEHFPRTPNVACFDTAFHARMPPVARALPIARQLRSEGVERYGFHGLSCESIVRQLGAEIPERLIIAHLGNGASVTAVKAGASIDTSMGLTPTGGLMMGTRCGDLDPSVLIYLMRKQSLDAAALEDLLDRHSGLLGVSGLASDMRALHEASPANADARLAVSMFCMSARKHIAGMIAALNGVDMIVFTGGIGENDAIARAGICEGLSWMGVALDAALNHAGATSISAPSSRCAIRVLPSMEDEEIALATARVERL